jgi:hypothetical protein
LRERDSHAAREDIGMRRLRKTCTGFEHRVECVAQSCERLVVPGVPRGVVTVRLRGLIEEAGGGMEVVVHGR